MVDTFFDVFGPEVDRGVEDDRRGLGLRVSFDVVERDESENRFRIGDVSGRNVSPEVDRVAVVGVVEQSETVTRAKEFKLFNGTFDHSYFFVKFFLIKIILNKIGWSMFPKFYFLLKDKDNLFRN